MDDDLRVDIRRNNSGKDSRNVRRRGLIAPELHIR